MYLAQKLQKLKLFLANFQSFCLKKIQCVFWVSSFFDNHKYNIITFRYIIHKPNERQSKFDKTYTVSWLKPKEHPFRISQESLVYFRFILDLLPKIYLSNKEKLFYRSSTSCLDCFMLPLMMMSGTLVLQTTF